MHSATQIIAQRAPPAIRTKPRWQPYHSITQSNALVLRSPTVACHTLPTIVPPSQDLCPIEISTKESALPAPIPPTPIAQTPKDAFQRDASKHKFAAGLIDQAVSILTEIWRPQDVPDVFKAPIKGSGIGSALAHGLPLTSHQSMPSISAYPPQTSLATLMANQYSSFSAAASQSGINPDSNLLPMKTFVHEVLKRSRTSGSILQAALCYLEAIRPKVPEILEQEKMGIRAHFQPETKILPATEAELVLEAELELAEMEQASGVHNIRQEPADESKTVRVTDGENGDFDGMQQIHEDSASISSLIAEPSLTPVNASSSRSVSLPSPLLCPRRAFLASLILASKFFQDKCYSNRAWAKLSGLPPREIGRCERALGQALEWRLWVGKSAIRATATPSPPTNRNIVRSQSESSVILSVPTTISVASVSKSLRKCATLPAEMFNTSSASIVHSDQLKSDVSIIASSSAPLLDPVSMYPQYTEKLASTPSPDTPGLTYSPSSTDSAGDSTIQMSTFEDGMFPSCSNSQPWTDATSAAPTETVGFSFGGNSKMPDAAYGCDFDPSRKKLQSRRIAIAGSDLGAFSSLHAGNCLWHADNRCISLETTDVH